MSLKAKVIKDFLLMNVVSKLLVRYLLDKNYLKLIHKFIQLYIVMGIKLFLMIAITYIVLQMCYISGIQFNILTFGKLACLVINKLLGVLDGKIELNV